MKKSNILFVILSFIIPVIPSTNALSQQTKDADQEFVVRVTANEPTTVIPFDATYMIISKQGASINNIKEVTPFEYAVNANFIGIMLEIADNNPDIKVDVIEKNKEDLHLTGSGHAIFAHAATNGNHYILAN